ncbi:MAG: hypothetical protein K8R40_02320 [Anaerolineaceae bacterium]|nr:hypothetical protein [Anaerolineaceae bacterium]
MNINEVMEVYNECQIKVEAIVEECYDEFMKPVNGLAMKTAAQKALAQPEMVKNVMRERNPEQYKNLIELAQPVQMGELKQTNSPRIERVK